MANKLEVEGKEILIKSSDGTMAVIPKDKVSMVKGYIASGNHGMVDKFVDTLKEFKHDNQKAGDGLYANIQAKRKRIAAGSGERMRKVGEAGAPTAAQFKQAAKTAKAEDGVKIAPPVKKDLIRRDETIVAPTRRIIATEPAPAAAPVDEYVGRPLKEVVVTSPDPQWLKYKKEYEQKNPKSAYVGKYLTPLARGLGNSETTYPKRNRRFDY